MTYIIQGTNGSLKYWVKLESDPDKSKYCFIWTGLKDNATWFKSRSAINQWVHYNREKIKMNYKVLPYEGVKRNLKPQI